MFALPHLPISVAFVAAQIPAKLFERTDQLRRRVEITGEKVALTLADCKRLRLERRQWRAVWSAVRARPDHIVVCCYYCARVRTPNGEWTAVPMGLSNALQQSLCVNFSHGICPDCMARYQSNPR